MRALIGSKPFTITLWKQKIALCFYFIKTIENVFPVFHRVMVTLMKVWENSKLLWKHSPACGSCFHSKRHSCYHNSMETRKTFSIWYMYTPISINVAG